MTTATTVRWHVVDRDGRRVAGPYKTQQQAALARLYLEQAEQKAFGLESDDDG